MENLTETLNNLLIDCPITSGALIEQRQRFICAGYSEREAESIVFGEEDALELSGEICDETSMWLDVRDIQKQITIEAGENNET